MEIKNNIDYLKILDFFPNPIWKSDVTGACDYFNKEWLRFTGRKIEQEMGYGWAEGVHKDDLERCVSLYKEHFSKKEPFLLKYRMRYNDGTYHWILDYGNPYFDEDKNFMGFIGSCYDNNENKVLLEKLTTQNEDLSSLNKMMVGRELKMIELKKKIEEMTNNCKV